MLPGQSVAAQNKPRNPLTLSIQRQASKSARKAAPMRLRISPKFILEMGVQNHTAHALWAKTARNVTGCLGIFG